MHATSQEPFPALQFQQKGSGVAHHAPQRRRTEDDAWQSWQIRRDAWPKEPGRDRDDMLTSRAPSFCPRRLCQPGPELMCCCACTGTRPDAAVKVPKLGDGLTDRLALRMTESCLYTHTHCCLVEALVVGKTVNKTHSTAWSCHHTC